MRNFVCFYVVAIICCGIVFFWLFLHEAAAVCTVLLCVAGAFFVAKDIKNDRRRKKWLESPVLPGSPDFDTFFWKQNFDNQIWYAKHVLKKEGVDFLKEKYEVAIRAIWQEQDMEVEEKIRKSGIFMKRLKFFIGYAEEIS